jgi:drug/metabolite transporter (DMT)-like permease
MILIFFLYFFCALTFPLAKATLTYVQPIFYVGIRMTLAGLLLLSVYRFYKGPLPPMKRSDVSLFLQVAFFAIYCAYILDLWSLQYLTSIESAFIFNLSPFIAALFSYFWFSEIMTPIKWIGLGLGSASLVPLLFARSGKAIALSVAQILPIVGLIISVAASAYGWIIMRELVKNRNYAPLFINGYCMFWAGLATLLTSYIFESWNPSPVFSWPEFIIYMIAIIIIANGIFSNLYSYLLKYYTATLLSFAGFLCPIFACLLGYFCLQEPLSWKFFFSLLCIISGLFLFYREELRQGYVA